MFACAFPTSLRGAVAAAVKPNWIAVFAEQVYQKAISIDNRRYSAGPTSRPLRSAENRQLHECMRASTHCGHCARLSDRRPEAHVNLAVALREAGRIDEARNATLYRSRVATHYCHAVLSCLGETRIQS